MLMKLTLVSRKSCSLKFFFCSVSVRISYLSCGPSVECPWHVGQLPSHVGQCEEPVIFQQFHSNTETLTLNTESYGNGDYIYDPVHQHIQEEINLSF
jgi:hypothetical protein